jgi:hypothetical protein
MSSVIPRDPEQTFERPGVFGWITCKAAKTASVKPPSRTRDEVRRESQDQILERKVLAGTTAINKDAK